MPRVADYPFKVRRLPEEDGGGCLVSFPDFAQCISDEETIQLANAKVRDALESTIAALRAKKLTVPAPNSGGVASGQFVAHVPKTVHAQLS